jgi:hypothetical protein
MGGGVLPRTNALSLVPRTALSDRRLMTTQVQAGDAEAPLGENNGLEVPRITLALQALPAQTFEHDVAVLERYHAYAAEVTRLALLGLTAVGALFVATLPSPEATRALTPVIGPVRWAAGVSLVLLGGSALVALLYHYVSTESLADHLRLCRLQVAEANAPQKSEARVNAADRDRRRNFGASTRLLAAALALLLMGIISFTTFCGYLMLAAGRAA